MSKKERKQLKKFRSKIGKEAGGKKSRKMRNSLVESKKQSVKQKIKLTDAKKSHKTLEWKKVRNYWEKDKRLEERYNKDEKHAK